MLNILNELKIVVAGNVKQVIIRMLLKRDVTNVLILNEFTLAIREQNQENHVLFGVRHELMWRK